MFTLSPLGILLSLPDFRHYDGDSPTIAAFNFFWRIKEVAVDIYGGLRGDPLVIYGKVLEKSDYGFEEKVTGVGTFGYELKIDIKRAVRISRDGRLRNDADRIESDALVQATRHVYRHSSDGQDVILLCNSAGTAIAVESELRDAALISALRDSLAGESEASNPEITTIPETSTPGDQVKAEADSEASADPVREPERIPPAQ